MGKPVSIVEPSRIRHGGFAILVPMPRVESVGAILQLENRVSEARLPKRRVTRLRLHEAAYPTTNHFIVIIK